MKILKEITKVELIVAGYKCDICGEIHEGEKYPDSWYNFSYHHSTWGLDSIEYLLVCSTECYFKGLKKALDEVGNEGIGSIDDKNQEFIENLLIIFG